MRATRSRSRLIPCALTSKPLSVGCVAGCVRPDRGRCSGPGVFGNTIRHRLNRGGDRQLNRALNTIVLTRIRTNPATRAYVDRRLAEGKTAKAIRRCLERYVARQIFRTLNAAQAIASAA